MISILASIGIGLLMAGINFIVNKRKMEKADAEARDTVFDQSSIPRTDDLSIIPVVFGTAILTSPNVAWYGFQASKENIVAADGSGAHTFHRMGLHLIFCQGPVDLLHEIRWEHGAFQGTQIGELDAVEVIGPDFWEKNLANDPTYAPMRIYQNGMLTPDPFLSHPSVFKDAYEYSQSLYKGLFSIVFGELPPAENPPYEDERKQPFLMAGLKTYHTTLPPIQATVTRAPERARLANGGANPAWIIEDVLTNPVWGMGIDPSILDWASFTLAEEILKNEEFGLCFVLTGQTTFESFLEEIKRHIDATIDVDRRTGKIRLTLIRGPESHPAGWPEPPAPIELGPDEIKRVETFKRPALLEQPTVQVVTYRRLYQDDEGVWHAGKDQSSTIAHDTAGALTRGVIAALPNDYPGVPNPQLAARIAQRDLRAVATPRATIEFTANPGVASELYAGGIVSITWPKYGLNQARFRVSSVDFGTLTNGEIRVIAAEDVFSFDAAAIEPPPVPERPKPLPVPDTGIVFEAPRKYADEFGALPVIVGISEKTFRAHTGYKLSVNEDEAVSAEFPYVDSFFPHVDHMTASSAAGRSFADTTITVEGGGLTVDAVGLFLLWGEEIVEVIGVPDSNQLTVARAMVDTVPHPHESGERLWVFSRRDSGIYMTAFAPAVPFQKLFGSTEEARMLSMVDTEELPYFNAEQHLIVQRRRHYAPLPPRHVTYVDGTGPGSLIVSFRCTDPTTDVMPRQTDPTEPRGFGVTFGMRVWGEVQYGLEGFLGEFMESTAPLNNTIELKSTDEAILNGLGRRSKWLRIEVFALDGGLESYQSWRLDIQR